MNMPVESPKFDASIRDLRQIRGVTGDLEIKLYEFAEHLMRLNRNFRTLAVCGAAVLSGCMFDEPMYYASDKLEKSWDVGPSPQVVADLFGGPIYVTASPDGKVIASVQIGTVSKVSQDVADKAVKAMIDGPGVTMTQEGDSIRIIELYGYRAVCSLNISVPVGTRLDVHAGAGDINVGASGTRAPVALASLKARQDSVGVLTVNVIGAPSRAPRLDLKGENLKLTVNGLPVEIGPPMRDNGLGAGKRWHFESN
jgi:hypothetical protein